MNYLIFVFVDNKKELKICNEENLPSSMIYEIDIHMQNKTLEPLLFLAPLNPEVFFFMSESVIYHRNCVQVTRPITSLRQLANVSTLNEGNSY